MLFRSPVITSQPITAATEDEAYSYQLAAGDDDVGDTLTWSVEIGPAGLAIDAAGESISVARDHASRRSGIGFTAESMPSRLTPRSRNGRILAGTSLPPALPHAATAPPYLSAGRTPARRAPPTVSTRRSGTSAAAPRSTHR